MLFRVSVVCLGGSRECNAAVSATLSESGWGKGAEGGHKVGPGQRGGVCDQAAVEGQKYSKHVQEHCPDLRNHVGLAPRQPDRLGIAARQGPYDSHVIDTIIAIALLCAADLSVQCVRLASCDPSMPPVRIDSGLWVRAAFVCCIVSDGFCVAYMFTPVSWYVLVHFRNSQSVPFCC